MSLLRRSVWRHLALCEDWSSVTELVTNYCRWSDTGLVSPDKMVSVGTILVSAATTYEFLGHTQQSDQPEIETSPHIVTNEISWLPE